MCWMTVKKAGNPVNEEYVDKAQKHNKDGYGVAWYENDYVQTYKTFDYEKFKGICKALEKHTLVIHLRHTTKGNNSYANIHPFEIPSGVMFHNGTMYKAPSTGVKSDSQGLADIISQCTYEEISDILPLIKPYVDDKINRLVFFEDSGEIIIINDELGIYDDNGDWYSNDYHLKDEGWCRSGYCNSKKKEVAKVTSLYVAKVFVYGTLKKGGRNNKILGDSLFLGNAKTQLKWTMIGNGYSFPYVLENNHKLGGYIHGEAYHVTKETLGRLDMLEGTPTHYRRNQTGIVYDSDSSVATAIMYVKTNFNGEYTKSMQLITNWEV